LLNIYGEGNTINGVNKFYNIIIYKMAKKTYRRKTTRKRRTQRGGFGPMALLALNLLPSLLTPGPAGVQY